MVHTSLSTVKTSLQEAESAARAAAALATSPRDLTADGINAAIQAILVAAETAVTELISDTGAYMLVVPIPKKGFVQLVPDSGSEAPGSTFFTLPLPNLIEQLPEARRARLRNLSVFDQLADSSQAFTGGNAYFLRTLGESLFDLRDSSRPKFTNQDYWAYGVFVGGATDLASIIPLAGHVERLIGHITQHGPTRGVVAVVPQNVRAAPSGRGRLGVIEWDPVEPSRFLASYDNNVVQPDEYIIIRSADFRAATCTQISELFGTETFTVGQNGRFGAKVLAVSTYDGVTARWVDPSPLANDTDYYYLVGFKCRVNVDGEHVELPYDKIVAAGPVRIRNGAAPLSHGKLPDWARIQSFATMFPPVERFLDMALERIRSIARASQTLSDFNDSYISALSREVERYSVLADNIARDVEHLSSMLTGASALAGIAMKTGTGNGPVSSFLAQVIEDFSDLSDPQRPAFDEGDEYVMGLVVLAVGPDPIAIAHQLDIFNLFFGTPDTNNLLAGINSIAASIPALEAQVAAAEAAATAFNPDMSPSATPVCDDNNNPTIAAPTFDASMRPQEP